MSRKKNKPATGFLLPQAIRLFSIALPVVSCLLVAIGYAWRGIDFATGVLLGSIVVAINFFWTRHTVGRAFMEGSSSTGLMISFLLKMALAGLVLYAAILEAGVDALGILLGVSSLFLTGIVLALRKLAP